VSQNNKAAPFNGALFNENRRKVPPEELSKYAGRYVAWNLEGTQIIASAAERETLYADLAAAGVPLDCVVQSYVPTEDEEAFL
jgi:hypothetical protein